MRHRKLLILSIIGTLALVGCADDDPDTAQTEPEPTATETVTETETRTETEAVTETETETGTDGQDVSAMAFATCEVERYTVGYPEDWNTNDPDGPADACRIFHPGEIELEEATEPGLHYAVNLYVDAVAYERARDSDPGGEVLEERELTIAGHDAVFREVVSDGEALVPEGETSATYIVDLDGEIFVATTYTIGDTDYERDKEILERLVTEELTFTNG